MAYRRSAILPDDRDADLACLRTAFNLLGIDRWVRDFRFVTYYDSFDGRHPDVLVSIEREPRRPFASIEEIVNYLLGHNEVIDMVGTVRPGRSPSSCST